MRTALKLLVLIAILLLARRFFTTGSLTGQTLELPLDVEAISGTPVQAGKPTIVEFWATWCPPCRQTIPHLNNIYSQYRLRGLQVVGITDESPDVVRSFQKSVPMQYTVGRDQTRQYFSRFGISGIPAMLLLDANGVIVWKGHPLEFNAEKQLEQLLPRSAAG